MTKKLIIVCGHPEEESLAGANAKALEKAAKAQEVEVEQMRTTDFPWIECDPARNPDKAPKEFCAVSEKLAQAEFVAFVVPFWNFGVTPTLSNFLLGICKPGIFFNFKSGGGLEKLLKTEKVIVVWTSGGPAWVYKYLIGNPLYSQVKSLFKFCGAKRVQQLSLGNIHGSGSDKEKASIAQFLRKLENYKF